mgnify:FL=1|tara:strand:+ start:4686 stop:6263 length:1578 start_codon:yes stop_codon:yes gene_type:complete
MNMRAMSISPALLGFLFLCSSGLLAQDAHTALFMDLAPQHTRLHLASRPSNGYLGMPLLGNLRIEMGNSLVHPVQWLSQVSGESEATFNLDAVRQSFSDRNDLSMDFQWDWLNAGGFSANRRSFWSVAVSEHIQSSIELPEDLMRLPFTGNASAALMASSLDFSSFQFQFSHRREFAASWQYEWNDKISSGLRVAYLQGLSYAGTRDNSTHWTINPDTYAWGVEGGLAMDVAGWPMANFEDSKEVSDYFNTKGNRGVSAAIALQFKPSEKWNGFIQIADLGKLNWSSDVQNWSIADTTMVFSGLVVDDTEALDAWPSDSLENWLESIGAAWEQAFAVDSSSSSFSQILLPKMSVGVSWQAFKTQRQEGTVGAWARSDGQGYWDWRLSYNHRFNERVGLAFSHGVNQSRKSTFGLALCLNAGPLAMFVATDHIGFSKWTRIVVEQMKEGAIASEEEFIVPNQSHAMQLQAGLTWRFGWRKSSSKHQKSNPAPNQSVFKGSSTRNPGMDSREHPGAVPCNAPGSWKD